MRASPGYTILELVVSVAIVAVLTATAFGAVRGGRDAFSVESERSDMLQRLRVGADALARDLMSAVAVRPYRADGPAADPPGSFRDDVVTVVGTTPTTYWLKSDDRTGTYQLMAYGGGAGADAPVVDHVVRLSLAYFGDPQPPTMVRPLADADGPWTTYGPRPPDIAVFPFGPGENCVFEDDGSGTPAPRLPALAAGGEHLVALAAAQFSDGPWCPDDMAPSRWDADLLRVRAIDVTLRVQAASAALRGPASALFLHGGTAAAASRWAPDVEIRFRVAPRNLNLAR